MYIVCRKLENGCDIYDTSDCSCEFVSNSDTFQLIKSGVEIYGVSISAIQKLLFHSCIIRFYDTYKNAVMIYDGYIMREESSFEMIDMYSVIDLFDIASAQELAVVIEILRKYNVDKYMYVSKDDPVSYKFIQLAEKNGVFLVKTRITNTVKTLDVFDCINIRYVEREQIDGLAITKDGVKIADKVILYGVVNLLWDIRNNRAYSCYGLEVQSYNEVMIDHATIKYNELGSNIVVLNGCNIPLFNIEKYKRKCDSEYSGRLYWKYGDLASFNRLNGVGEFSNGDSLRFEDSFWFIKLCSDNNLLADIYAYCEKEQYKSRMLGIEPFFKNRLDVGINLHDTDGFGRMIPYPYSSANVENFIFPIRTEHGSLQIEYKKLPDSLFNYSSEFDSIFLARVTHLGTVIYDLKTYSLQVGVSRIANNSIFSNYKEEIYDLHNIVEYAEINGMSALNGNIIPICVHSITSYSSGNFGVFIACLIPRYCSQFEESGNSIVVIPLHLICGKYEEYKDCYVFKTLLHDVVMSKDFARNQLAIVYSDMQKLQLLNAGDRNKSKFSKYMEIMSINSSKTLKNICEAFEIL